MIVRVPLTKCATASTANTSTPFVSSGVVLAERSRYSLVGREREIGHHVYNASHGSTSATRAPIIESDKAAIGDDANNSACMSTCGNKGPDGGCGGGEGEPD